MSQSNIEPSSSPVFVGRAIFVVDENGALTVRDETIAPLFGLVEIGEPLWKMVAAPNALAPFRSDLLDALRLLAAGDARTQHLDFIAQTQEKNKFAASLEIARTEPFEAQNPRFEARLRAKSPEIAPEQSASSLLHPAQNQLQTLVEAVRDGVLAHDSGGKWIYANQTAANQLGFGSVLGLLATPARQVWERFQITHEAGETLDLSALPHTLQDGKNLESSLIFRDESGEEKCFLATICALEAGATLFVFHEISARRRSDVELLLALQKQERAAAETAGILAQIADAVILTDATGRITFLNDAARALPGINGDAKDENTLYQGDFLTPEGEPLPLSEAPLAQVLRADENLLGGQWLVREPNGRETVLQGSAAPLRTASGELVGAVLVLRDISEQRRMMAEMEKANSLKDDFLSILSHELRTPLTPLIGWISLLRNMLAPGRTLQPPLLDKIVVGLETNVEQQQKIVEELLNATTLLVGRTHFQKTPYPLATLMRETLDALEQKGKTTHVQMECDFASDVPIIPIDLGRLSQAIHHLLDNAIAFSPQGGTIWIATRHENGEVILSVRDEGPGLSAEFLPHLFEPFRQSEESSTRHHGGLGLGLALVRAIAEGHGGQVEAFSAGAGQGAKIVMRLPV